MTPRSFLYLPVGTAFVLLAVTSVAAAAGDEPDINLFADQADTLKPEDFVFDLQGSKPAVDQDGGKQFVMNQENTPGLRLGSALPRGGGEQVLFEFEPCGFRTPHHHPRATENFFVIDGHIAANFISESGNLITNNITKGFSGFFPLAHIHFLQNIGCKPAITLSVLDNPDPGVYDVATSLNFPPDTIQVTLGNSKLRPNDELLATVLPQSIACLKRCGLWKGDKYHKDEYKEERKDEHKEEHENFAKISADVANV